MNSRDKHFCPNCHADLRNQYGFDSKKNVWICIECGQMLYGDNVYDGDQFPGVMWICDNCASLLNTQLGFSDNSGTWICTECGHRNSISEDQICSDRKILPLRAFPFAADEGDDKDDDDDDDGNEYDDDEYDDDEYDDDDDSKNDNGNNDDNDVNDAINDIKDQLMNIRNNINCIIHHTAPESINHPSPSKPIKEQSSSKSETNSTNLAIILGCVSFFIVVIGFIAFYFSSTYTHIPESAKKLIGQNYQIVERQFKDAGFTNITSIPVADLSDGWFTKATSKIDTIDSISINGNTSFKKDAECPKDSPITIYYHVYPSSDE